MMSRGKGYKVFSGSSKRYFPHLSGVSRVAASSRAKRWRRAGNLCRVLRDPDGKYTVWMYQEHPVKW